MFLRVQKPAVALVLQDAYRSFFVISSARLQSVSVRVDTLSKLRELTRLDRCVSSVVAAHESQGLYSEFDDEFEDIETPVGQCVALYTFEGTLY